MTSHRHCISRILIFILFSVAGTLVHAQQIPYPIIFVHGINSNDATWEKSVGFFRDHFGWNDPYYNDQGILHFVLNAYKDMTRIEGPDGIIHNIDDDVLLLNFDENGHKVNSLYPGNVFAINFKNFWNENIAAPFVKIHSSGKPGWRESSGNESSIVKQGYALGQMIKRVLLKTGAEKVVLVGHSMGGLAAREYLQRTDLAGRHKWWVDPDSPGGHRVAKLVTIGTPHGGSNATDFAALLTINPNSEASRDLHYNYDDSHEAGAPGEIDNGIYLFGGSETLFSFRNELYHNNDIDCDGSDTSQVVGINSKDPHIANPDMSLPEDVDYTWIISNHGGSGGDKAVRLSRQYLTSHGHTLLTDKIHYGETGDYYSLIRGLDEPDIKKLAYEIRANQSYQVFSTYQSDNQEVDVDWLKYVPLASGYYILELRNAPVSRPSKLALYLGLDSMVPFMEITAEELQSDLVLSNVITTVDDIYIRIETTATADSWKNPMTLTWRTIGEPAGLSLKGATSILKAEAGGEITLSAKVLDTNGQHNTEADNTIQFRITSGAASANLVGTNPVQTEKGIATVTLQATGIPGLVTIEASSPDIATAVTRVNIYNAATEVSGEIAADETWVLANSPYVLAGDITIRAGAVLTIEPGVTIQGKKNTDIYVQGGLVAVGTHELPIVFEGAETAIPGSWGGIRFENGAVSSKSVLDYCMIRHAGQSGYRNVGAPLSISGYVNPSVTNTTLENNTINGIRLDAGTYTADIQLGITGLPYYAAGDITINAGSVLTIKPGVCIKMSPHADFFIHGGLIAEGRAGHRIIFTSLRDDSKLGDTNGDGASSGTPAEWGGVGIYGSIDDARTRLSYVDFYFSGQGGYRNHDAPIYLELRANPAIDAVRLLNNKLNGIKLQTGSFQSDIHIKNYNIPMIVKGDLTIEQSAKLTIEPGVLFKMWPDTDFYISGILDADNQNEKSIVFTSWRDDSMMGDTNGDGSTAGVAGDYGGIHLSGSAQQSYLVNADIHFAGSGGYRNVGYPLKLDARADVKIHNTRLHKCTTHGVNLINGTYESDITLDHTDLPYIIFGDLAVSQSAKMTIAAGMHFKMKPGADIIIQGLLDARGVEGDSIIFTSFRDDSYAGDTNGDGVSRGVPGDWGGIELRGSAADQSQIGWVKVLYGGSGGYLNNRALMSFNGTSPRVEHSVFGHTGYYGIHCLTNSSPDLGGGAHQSPGENYFLGFAGENKIAIYNDSADDVFAKHNAWGTTDVQKIARMIYDYSDKNTHGHVFFDPIQDALPTSVSASGKGGMPDTVPEVFNLYQNYPNPFNMQTTIKFDVPDFRETHIISLKIFAINGALLKTLFEGAIDPGAHTVAWDGNDGAGRPVSSGIYLLQIRGGSFSKSIKIAVIK